MKKRNIITLAALMLSFALSLGCFVLQGQGVGAAAAESLIVTVADSDPINVTTSGKTTLTAEQKAIWDGVDGIELESVGTSAEGATGSVKFAFYGTYLAIYAEITDSTNDPKTEYIYYKVSEGDSVAEGRGHANDGKWCAVVTNTVFKQTAWQQAYSDGKYYIGIAIDLGTEITSSNEISVIFKYGDSLGGASWGDGGYARTIAFEGIVNMKEKEEVYDRKAVTVANANSAPFIMDDGYLQKQAEAWVDAQTVNFEAVYGEGITGKAQMVVFGDYLCIAAEITDSTRYYGNSVGDGISLGVQAGSKSVIWIHPTNSSIGGSGKWGANMGGELDIGMMSEGEQYSSAYIDGVYNIAYRVKLGSEIITENNKIYVDLLYIDAQTATTPFNQGEAAIRLGSTAPEMSKLSHYVEVTLPEYKSATSSVFKRPEAVAEYGTPSMDLVIEPEWKNVSKNALDIQHVAGYEYPGSTGYFKLIWNENGLYVLVVIGDETKNYDMSEHSGTYQVDSIQVYVDMLNDINSYVDREACVYNGSDAAYWGFTGDGSITGSLVTGTNLDGLEVVMASRETAGGYLAKVFIPWGNYSAKAQEGSKIGFDVVYNDNEYGFGRTGCLSWSSNDGMEFLYYDKMGQVVLNKGETIVFDTIKGIKDATEGFTATVGAVTNDSAEVALDCAGASEYTVYVYDQNGEFITSQSCNATAVISGLYDGETYKVQAVAFDSAGEVLGYSQVVEVECKEEQSSESTTPSADNSQAGSSDGEEGGCVGSIGATGIVAAAGAVAVVLLKKKKERDE